MMTSAEKRNFDAKNNVFKSYKVIGPYYRLADIEARMQPQAKNPFSLLR